MNALEVQNVSKVYRLYAKPVDRLKELITRRPHHQSFVALENISFSIPFGETLGIIGANGAGKSTLLKILAGTLTPTTGTVINHGRVAALLELGAGFHPEFTGRQNIYLNASLMGLSKAEIKEREHDIIDFSELGNFIDRPVKTYSSGMYVRLAFSIATTVDPDILIIDEALSVGDQHFQKKCIDRMVHFRKAGKTILFCSHSMYLVEELCRQAIWLANGRMQNYGATPDVIGAYLAYLENMENRAIGKEERPSADSSALPDVLIEYVHILDSHGETLEHIGKSQDVVIQVKTKRVGLPLEGHIGIGLMRADGQLVFGTSTKLAGLKPILFTGEQVTELVIPSLPLLYGTYQVKTAVADQYTLRCFCEHITDAISISCERPELGMFWMEHDWRIPTTS